MPKVMENLICTPRDLLTRTPARMSSRALSRGLRIITPLAGAALLILWTFLSPKLLHGQASAASQTTPPASAKPAAHRSAAHRRATVHRAALRTRPAAAAPVAPPAPPKPNWPAEQPPNPAKVSWDSQGLAIEASNSSLDQILHEVATDTGVKLQGLNQDERIFGNYGPGPAREVLSRLLEGSGYNVLMIGGQGDEPPQQIILTRSAVGSPQPANAQNNNAEESDADEQSQQPADTPQPMPLRSPFGVGGPANRTPQEIQQEMLMRQQQIEQQREQEQQNSPQY